jgi:hypothetical protein
MPLINSTCTRHGNDFYHFKSANGKIANPYDTYHQAQDKHKSSIAIPNKE